MTSISERQKKRTQMDLADQLFVATSFFIQIFLLAHFAMRKWDFAVAMRWGWLIYALAIPAVIISLALLAARKPWGFWLAGFLYAAWAAFGYTVDIARPVVWRSPIFLPVFLPYVLLYLAAQMFYWWPLAKIQRRLWTVYAVLFVISTFLNITSHA